MRLTIDDHGRPRAAEQPPARAFGLWNLGFRPFYWLASVFAAISIALWTAQYAGYMPFVYVQSPTWHGSEMLFGFTLAVIAGFLFTAVRNWTGQPTPTGLPLAALALLWVAGRVLAATPYATAAAVVNAAFPIGVAVGIAHPLLRAGNRRNYFFVGLLAALTAIAVALMLSRADVLRWPERASLRVGLDVVIFIMAVMGGRVIPMFTNNGVPGTQARRVAGVERVALAGIPLLALADLAQAPPAAIAVLLAILALAHGTRLMLWQPWRTWRVPIVWVLHAAYAWIVVHFVLRLLAAFDLVADPLAIHALTIGGIGGLTIGMMTRTARGHTGRPLVANRFDVACYVLVNAAALSRVFGALAWPRAYVATVVVAGICWSAAYAIYAVTYWPSLSRARVDGKPG